jgi:hypothetical protein
MKMTSPPLVKIAKADSNYNRSHLFQGSSSLALLDAVKHSASNKGIVHAIHLKLFIVDMIYRSQVHQFVGLR